MHQYSFSDCPVTLILEEPIFPFPASSDLEEMAKWWFIPCLSWVAEEDLQSWFCASAKVLRVV